MSAPTTTRPDLTLIWHQIDKAFPEESRWTRLGSIWAALREIGADAELHEIRCTDPDSGVSAQDYYLRSGGEGAMQDDIETMEANLRALVEDWGSGQRAKVSFRHWRSNSLSIPKQISEVEKPLMIKALGIVHQDRQRQVLDEATGEAAGAGSHRRL